MADSAQHSDLNRAVSTNRVLHAAFVRQILFCRCPPLSRSGVWGMPPRRCQSDNSHKMSDVELSAMLKHAVVTTAAARRLESLPCPALFSL